MSFIFKQMLDYINTDIEALQLEDINIGLGGVALSESIAENAVDIASLLDEVNQLKLKNINFGFRVTGNFGNQSVSNGLVIKFNLVDTDSRCHVEPNLSDFDTGNFRNIVPINGMYNFSSSLFINSSSGARIGLYINDDCVGFLSQDNYNGRNMNINVRCTLGEVVSLRYNHGDVVIHLNPTYSWFQGFRISA